ncbi:unnamed protein product [Notodromas monacha]|uniref:Uncharacterized protein n=1 Tax=Notodromas monacha TaxID=399045 RepID=A0A7R9BJK4_9CRUS|nr:unnamed protein product [Notodromas monacha]CAG0916406.1 unnamed protein product [Notodromas monacha]
MPREIYRFHDMEYEEINMVVSSTGPYEPKFSGSVGVSCFDPRTKRKGYMFPHGLKMFLELNKAQFQMYKDKPKLFFTFQKQYSHDDSTRFRAVDKDVAEYLKWFTSNPEVYNTTVLIITDKSMVTGVSKEGQTLLQPVVKSRTCNEAGVPTRLCGCKESWKELDASDLKTLPNTAMDVASASEAVLAYMRKTATTPLFSHVGLSRPKRIPEELHFLFQNHVLFASDHLPKAKRKIPREMGYSPASSFSTCMDWGLEDIELMSMRRIQARKDTVGLQLTLGFSAGTSNSFYGAQSQERGPSKLQKVPDLVLPHSS